RPQAGRHPRRRPGSHRRLACWGAELPLSEGHTDRPRHELGAHRHRPLPAGAGRPVRRLRLARLRDRAGAQGSLEVMAAAWARALVLVFVAAMVQVVVVEPIVVGGGAPDLLLVVVVSVGLLRGSIPGAMLGFVGGLVVDFATLGTLGVTSLVLTLGGFWAGRYGETTARERRVAPLLAVGAITLLGGAFGYVLYYLLGEQVVARQALVTALAPAFVMNLILALPVHRLTRAIVGEELRLEPSPEVEVLV